MRPHGHDPCLPPSTWAGGAGWCWGNLLKDKRKILPGHTWVGYRSYPCCPCSSGAPTQPFLGVKVAAGEEVKRYHACLWLLLPCAGEQRPILRREYQAVWPLLQRQSWVKIWVKIAERTIHGASTCLEQAITYHLQRMTKSHCVVFISR